MNKRDITVNILKCPNGYRMSSPENPSRSCYLCSSMYEKIIGEEVVGEVTFIFRKIKGIAEEYVFPFRFNDGALESHYIEDKDDKYAWNYLKYDDLLGVAINIELLKKWVGKSMFSIEMEYEIEI